ncbi:unnamed protein product [Calicophoron daubneyi]|uniref:DRBM domain-containing protein n=1 Tax=Calicophoron daubneyi TaxID=300641 RepID=A0AAV2TRQ2_CALDB
MNELKEPSKKKAKTVPKSAEESETTDPVRRGQVDAHVQAFLQAVLEHAHGSSLTNNGGVRKPKKSTRDAATQTEETEEISYNAANGSSFASLRTGDGTLSDLLQAPTGQLYSAGCVPNREMYSQETLNFVSQQQAYADQAQELSYVMPSRQYYTDNASCISSDALGAQKSGRISPSKVREVINQWVERYEQWFYQNFGLDVKTASLSEQSAPATSPATAITTFSSVENVPNPAVAQPNTVVSHAPVSYVVPEGSLCMPESHLFSPYVSLLPSFYTSAAFNRAFQQIAIQPPMPNLVNPMVVLSSQTVAPVYCQVPATSAIPPAVMTPPIPPTITSSFYIPPNGLGSLSVLSCNSSIPLTAPVNQNAAPPTVASFADLPTELQTSAMLAALSLPIVNGDKNNTSQWGPVMRYGTYGRLPSASEVELLSRQKASYQTNDQSNLVEQSAKNVDVSTVSKQASVNNKKMPPPPPTFILLRRQAMICALQLSCRERAKELFLREKEGTSGMKIDYPAELEVIAEKSISLKPVYLYTKLGKLSAAERRHFITEEESSGNTSGGCEMNQEGSNPQELSLPLKRSTFFEASKMYVCDLLIGDVLIAEGCSTSKLQARACVARQTFQILSKPCFLVGSVRRWEGVEYLVLCLSPKAELVPQLPPFLSDPFDSSKIIFNTETGNPEENFEVVNCKPFDDLWLYMGSLPLEALDDEAFTDRILAQSAEFSQMTIGFEVEVNTETGLFCGCALVDTHRSPSVSSRSVSATQKAAAANLLSSLRATQPVVGLQSDIATDPYEEVLPLWGISETSLVDTLMWGKEERDLAIDIEQLEAHCEVPSNPSSVRASGSAENNDVPDSSDGNIFSSPEHLDNLLQAYAVAALVTPLRLSYSTVPPSLWPTVRQLASNWGLLSQVVCHPSDQSSLPFLLVCKRAPLPRLKRSLYEKGAYGCFCLLSKGNLSTDALKRLLLADPLFYENSEQNHIGSESSPRTPTNSPSFCRSFSPSIFGTGDDPYRDEPVTRLARQFVSTDPKRFAVKSEPMADESKPETDDCVLVTAELNQPSNAIEILDDLPRTLIPGIDF